MNENRVTMTIRGDSLTDVLGDIEHALRGSIPQAMADPEAPRPVVMDDAACVEWTHAQIAVINEALEARGIKLTAVLVPQEADSPEPEQGPTTTTTVRKKRASKKKAAAKAAEKPEETPEPEEAPKGGEEAPEPQEPAQAAEGANGKDPDPVTMEDVIQKLIGVYAKPEGKPAVAKLQETYGVKKFTEIPEEKHPDFIKDALAVVEEHA